MAVADPTEADVCPVCGKVYEEVIGPPRTEVVGGVHGTPIEKQLFPWMCAYSVGNDVFVVYHEDPP